MCIIRLKSRCGIFRKEKSSGTSNSGVVVCGRLSCAGNIYQCIVGWHRYLPSIFEGYGIVKQ